MKQQLKDILRQVPWIGVGCILLTGVLIILVVMFFPGGFAQIALQIKLWFKKKFSKTGKGVA